LGFFLGAFFFVCAGDQGGVEIAGSWPWIFSHYWIDRTEGWKLVLNSQPLLDRLQFGASGHESLALCLCCWAPFLVTGENSGFVKNPTPFLGPFVFVGTHPGQNFHGHLSESVRSSHSWHKRLTPKIRAVLGYVGYGQAQLTFICFKTLGTRAVSWERKF
jgi:hypothetical protein